VILSPDPGNPALRCDMEVLIVEDDRAAIEILGFVIGNRFPQSTITFAYDGRMGLERFKERHHDIVITDINMSKMDGVAMAKEIKAIKEDTRIIILTAYSDRVHVEKFREIGINQHLMKPVEFDKLFAAIDRLIKEIEPER
jgi:YesN/AraC family two-component response regulator